MLYKLFISWIQIVHIFAIMFYNVLNIMCNCILEVYIIIRCDFLHTYYSYKCDILLLILMNWNTYNKLTILLDIIKLISLKHWVQGGYLIKCLPDDSPQVICVMNWWWDRMIQHSKLWTTGYRDLILYILNLLCYFLIKFHLQTIRFIVNLTSVIVMLFLYLISLTLLVACWIVYNQVFVLLLSCYRFIRNI